MKKTLTALLALTAAATVATASAQGRISAQSIIVNPTPTNLQVSVWTDRGSGSSVPNYVPGEQIKIYASVNQDAYVYLFNVDVDGTVDLILPNNYSGGSNFLKANTTKVFPAANAGFNFTVSTPYGLNKVLALASRAPLNLGQLATFSRQQNTFATVNVRGEQGLAQALSIVVNPVPQDSWVSNIAYYNVVAGYNAVQPANPGPVYPVQPVWPAQPAQPAQTATPILDLIGSLFSGVVNWNFTSPVRATFDQQVEQLQYEGFTLISTRSINGGFEATLQSNTSTAKLTVVQGAGRTVNVSVTKTTRYRY